METIDHNTTIEEVREKHNELVKKFNDYRGFVTKLEDDLEAAIALSQKLNKDISTLRAINNSIFNRFETIKKVIDSEANEVEKYKSIKKLVMSARYNVRT